MVDLRITVALPGAVFSSPSSGSSAVQFGQVARAHTIYVDDARRLGNTDPRTYYAYYKWNGPNVAIPVWDHKIGIGGGEVCQLPNQAGVPLRPGG
jgi:hypothetical protein